MNKMNEHGDGTKGKGGPRTKAGKERTRLNATKHGLYAKLSGTGSELQRMKARLYRKFKKQISAECRPVGMVREQLADAAADVLVRKALVQHWEETKIEEEIEKRRRAFKELEEEHLHHASSAQKLAAELAKLAEEQQAGLGWLFSGGVRDAFLAGFLGSQAGPGAGETFLSLASPQERQDFFVDLVKWDQATLWSILATQMRSEMEAHNVRAEELASELERGMKDRNGDRSELGITLLSKADMEFALDSINKCNRQFARSIDLLMRYRDEEANRPGGGGSTSTGPEASNNQQPG